MLPSSMLRKLQQERNQIQEDLDIEIPDEEPLDNNRAEMMTCPSELKAGLPKKDFSGNSEDSNR